MEIVEVKDHETRKEFLLLPVRLYKNEQAWIRPLDKDIESVFDPEKNKAFRHGECIRWILRDRGETIGRVAAFVNRKTIEKGDIPAGGMGFFECVDDRTAAFMLFDRCRSWLEEKGLQAMDGPINFGERDKWWGLLVEGFYEPNYCMPYNFPYYQDLFESYGFQVYFRQFTFQRPMGPEVDVSDKMKTRAESVIGDSDYSFRHLVRSEAGKAPELFRTVYNKAWAHHGGIKEMSSLQARNIFSQLKPIIDWKLIWFGFYREEPIAFFIMIPEINQIFKKLDGKLDLIGKLRFLYYKWTGSCRKALGIVFGVVPEFQGKGVESAIIRSYTGMAWKPGFQYNDLEMNWIGDFNPKMIRVVEQIGARVLKTHITYRKLFDPSVPFKRMPIIGK